MLLMLLANLNPQVNKKVSYYLILTIIKLNTRY